MRGMYNTNALETFIGAVEGVRSDQRASDENRMRMRALDSQLATEQAERDLLPARLALDSKKLEYEMSVGKMDMLLKAASAVDVMQTNSLDRTIKGDQHQEWKKFATLREGMANIEYQMASMNAWGRVLELGHQARQWAQQDLYGPLYAMATFLTSIAPSLVQASAVIEKGDKEVKSRMQFIRDRWVDPGKKDAQGNYTDFRGDYSAVIDWSNFASGRKGKRTPDDAAMGLGYAISQDYGDRYREVDADGKTQYKPPTDATSQTAALTGARNNLYARHLIDRGRNYQDAKPGLIEAQGLYNSSSEVIDEIVRAKAAETKNPTLAKEINAKIDLLLYNTDAGAQAELRDYLMKNGGEPLVNAVFGTQNLAGLQQYGYFIAGFGELDSKTGTTSFGREVSDIDLGKQYIENEAKRMVPDELLFGDDFNGILTAKAQRDGTVKLLTEAEDMMGLGANSAGDVFKRAMSVDLLKGIADRGGVDANGKPYTVWSMQAELGEEQVKRLDGYRAAITGIDSKVSAGGYGSAYKGQ